MEEGAAGQRAVICPKHNAEMFGEGDVCGGAGSQTPFGQRTLTLEGNGDEGGHVHI